MWPHRRQPPASPIPGILQARTLEWVAISFSNAWKWKVKVKSLSCVRLFMTPWTATYQAPPSMRFSRQEYWSGVPLPSPKSKDEVVAKERDKCWSLVRNNKIAGMSRENTETREWMWGKLRSIISQVEEVKFKEIVIKYQMPQVSEFNWKQSFRMCFGNSNPLAIAVALNTEVRVLWQENISRIVDMQNR